MTTHVIQPHRRVRRCRPAKGVERQDGGFLADHSPDCQAPDVTLLGSEDRLLRYVDEMVRSLDASHVVSRPV
jgi:hypothetical protein